jgi:hypothetical protein
MSTADAFDQTKVGQDAQRPATCTDAFLGRYRIGLHTPAAVHYGDADAITVARQQVLDTAWAQNPERFTRRPQPKSLRRADTAWINKPEPTTAQHEAMILAA